MTHATHSKIVAAVILLGAAVAMAFLQISSAQEGKPPALPLPEMQKLSKLYVGTWDYTETYPKSAFAPNGGVNTGVYTSELGPGGNSIINHFHSKGPIGEFVGVIVMTWDPKQNAYQSWIFGDSFPGAVSELGKWDGENLVYSGEMSMGPRKITLRNSTQFLSDKKLISEEYSSSNGGPEKLLVRVEATKK